MKTELIIITAALLTACLSISDRSFYEDTQELGESIHTKISNLCSVRFHVNLL